MIEVFKTNVQYPHQADILLGKIHNSLPHHRANFDLEDCDRILRVKCTEGPILISSLTELVMQSGFHAEVLPDEYP